MTGATALPRIAVVAGILERPNGEVLVAQRPAGGHMAGAWEFPGGKIHDGETPLEALVRELHEELGVAARYVRPLVRLDHMYPDRRVDLRFWRVLDWTGEPQSAEGQALQWLPPGQLNDAGLLPADRPVVDALLGNRPVMRLKGFARSVFADA